MASGLRIGPPEAKARVDAGQAIILDAVAPQAWDQLDVAIRGAIRISPDEIETRFRELPRGKQIIAYCT
jgi:rhodanese-related sulfurtransferase